MRQGEQTATLGGLRAWFKVRGDGPVCLFPSPGWGASSDLYFNTFERMERSLTIVYFDTRGSGRSGRPSSRQGYRLERFTSDLDELRAYLGQPAVWVMGHSFGGLLAQFFALEHPESCSGLILLDSTAALDDEAQADIEMRKKRRAGEPWFADADAAQSGLDVTTDAGFKDYFRRILPLYFHDVSKMQAADDALAAMTYSIEAYAVMTVNDLEVKKGALDRLAQIHVPTLIVVGDDDFICSPVQASRIHLRIPGSKLVLIEQAGHFPWIEQPEAFFRGIEDALRLAGITDLSP